MRKSLNMNFNTLPPPARPSIPSPSAHTTTPPPQPHPPPTPPPPPTPTHTHTPTPHPPHHTHTHTHTHPHPHFLPMNSSWFLSQLCEEEEKCLICSHDDIQKLQRMNWAAGMAPINSFKHSKHWITMCLVKCLTTTLHYCLFKSIALVLLPIRLILRLQLKTNVNVM